jgi:glycosyltransferase involved in cell wall biosynthesis
MVESAVYVVPLRIGGGTRLKILQAFAMKKAVISTSVGCEGLGLVHGEHILISDDPKEFADNVIKLARDKQLRRKLGENGRLLVQDKYDWKAIAEKLDGVYRRLINQTTD